MTIDLRNLQPVPSSCVVLVCSGCQHKTATIALNRLAVRAYATETRYAPNVPLPQGWKAVTTGPDCGFLCPVCVRESAEIIAQMRNGNCGRKI